jgi:hypothetical protein
LKLFLHRKRKHSFKSEAGTITGDVLINDFFTVSAGMEAKKKSLPLICSRWKLLVA